MSNGEITPPNPNKTPSGQGQNQTPPKPSPKVNGASVQKSVPVAKPPVQKSRKTLLFSFIGLFFFLFVLFFVFLVVMLFQNGGNNPILGALGVEPVLLQQLLQTLISLIFGFLAFVALVVSLIGFFRRFTAAPAELEKKKQSLVLGLVSGALFVFCMMVWLVLYFYISRLQLGTAGSAVILSDPANTVNMTAPVSVTFSAQEVEVLYNREGIVSYAWDLDGDGAFDDGNGRDIQYRYASRGNADGIYNVAVKIILGTGQEVTVQKLVTIANVLPTIGVDYTPKVLNVPVELTFNASGSRDPDGSIISYEWDFDLDGEIDAQGATVRRNFTEPVLQEVVLRVTDNNGQAAEERISLNFQVGQQKQAVIVVRPGVTGQAPYKASFDASNTFIDERVQSYEWDFGDGSRPVSGRITEHEYATAGNYTVSLRVIGESGQRYQAEETVVVQRAQNAPTPVLEVKNATLSSGVIRGEAPFSVQFDASKSVDKDGTIVEHRWDFDGDGEADAFGAEASYTFSENKTYEVTLTVIDNDELQGTSKVSIIVTVPEVLIDLQVSTFSGPAPLEVTFDASSSRAQDGQIISYTWQFGDNGSEVIGSARQTHVYTQVGEYQAQVSVVTDTGKRATKQVLIVAREVELQAEFSFNPPVAKVGEKVFFDGSTSQGQISRYYWQFGDGSISRVVKPDHVFASPGTYTVQLEVYDRTNRISRKEVELRVE
ncbi:MAG: PKD domain-containing protein [Candidatus Altimarinota bacterium]